MSTLLTQFKQLNQDELHYNQLDLCVPIETIYKHYTQLYRQYKQVVKRGLIDFIGKPGLKADEMGIIDQLDVLKVAFIKEKSKWDVCEGEVRQSNQKEHE